MRHRCRRAAMAASRSAPADAQCRGARACPPIRSSCIAARSTARTPTMPAAEPGARLRESDHARRPRRSGRRRSECWRVRQRRGCGASSAGRRSAARAGRNRPARAPSASPVEIGPEHVGEQQFGIGRLPEQEIGEALLAGGADDQVERRQVARCRARARTRRSIVVGISRRPAAAAVPRGARRSRPGRRS